MRPLTGFRGSVTSLPYLQSRPLWWEFIIIWHHVFPRGHLQSINLLGISPHLVVNVPVHLHVQCIWKIMMPLGAFACNFPWHTIIILKSLWTAFGVILILFINPPPPRMWYDVMKLMRKNATMCHMHMHDFQDNSKTLQTGVLPMQPSLFYMYSLVRKR